MKTHRKVECALMCFVGLAQFQDLSFSGLVRLSIIDIIGFYVYTYLKQIS